MFAISDLKRLVNTKLSLAIRSSDEAQQKEARNFLTLLDIEWSDQVTKLARVILDVKHFNKPVELPQPKDIKGCVSKKCRSFPCLTPDLQQEAIRPDASNDVSP